LIAATIDLYLLSSLCWTSLQVVFTQAVCAIALKGVRSKSVVTRSSVLFLDMSKLWLAVVVGSGILRPPCLTGRAVSLWRGTMFSGDSSNRAVRKCSVMAFLIGAKAILMSGVTR
jgi:hypothetical protein